MRKLEPIIADDVVWGRAYYEMHEVDAVIAELKGDMNDLIDDRVSSMKLINEKNSIIAQLEDDVAFWKSKYHDCKRELDLLKDTNAFYKGDK